MVGRSLARGAYDGERSTMLEKAAALKEEIVSFNFTSIMEVTEVTPRHPDTQDVGF